MNALLLSTALVATPPPAPHIPETGGVGGLHVQLSGDAVYGFAGPSSLGALLNSTLSYAVWDRGLATGALELGVQLQYNNEPTWLAPWLRGMDVSGATHRIQLVLTAGHGFTMGKRRRVYLGAHFYGGWNHWLSSYSVNYPDEGVSGHAAYSRNHFVSGGQLGLGYRITRRVGVNLISGGPFPTQSPYAIGFVYVGVGLTLYLR